jgi:hypothetical protein
MSAAMHGKTVGAIVCAQRVFTLWMMRLEGTALHMLKIFMAELQELFDPPMYIFSGYAFASQ